MSAFDEMLCKDLQDNFFNPEEFGEVVSLVRSGATHRINALFINPSMDGENNGSAVESITHQPALHVSLSDLPGGIPTKSDVFELSEKPGFHKSGTYIAEDFANEADGIVVYKLKEVLS